MKYRMSTLYPTKHGQIKTQANCTCRSDSLICVLFLDKDMLFLRYSKSICLCFNDLPFLVFFN